MVLPEGEGDGKRRRRKRSIWCDDDDARAHDIANAFNVATSLREARAHDDCEMIEQCPFLT